MAFGKKATKPKFEPVWGQEFWTDTVRLQFVNLKEVDSGSQYSRNKFCVTALVPQDDEAGLAIITDGICSVVSEHTGEEVSIDDIEKHPLLDKNGEIRDGNDEKYVEYEGYAGHYFFTPVANEENQPECLALPEDGDPEGVYEVDPSEIYAGCYARLLLLPWIYEEGKVTFALRAVVKVADGERFKTAAPQSAKSSFVAKWAQKPEAAAPAKKVVKKAVPAEDEGEEQEAPAAKKRGRPAGKLNGAAKAAASEEEEETGEEEGSEEEEVPPAKPASKGLSGLNKGKPVSVSSIKKGPNPGYRQPPEEAAAPVKKGLAKAKGLSSRL